MTNQQNNRSSVTVSDESRLASDVDNAIRAYVDALVQKGYDNRDVGLLLGNQVRGSVRHHNLFEGFADEVFEAFAEVVRG